MSSGVKGFLCGAGAAVLIFVGGIVLMHYSSSIHAEDVGATAVAVGFMTGLLIGLFDD